MAPIGATHDDQPTRPKEIIEQTFNVFCGPQQTMDQVGFAKFCESSKRALVSDADVVYNTVVDNVHIGMELSEFKAALGLLVNADKSRSPRTDRKSNILLGADRKSVSECYEVRKPCELQVRKPVRQRSTARKSSSENHSKNKRVDISLKSKTSSTFRWSPLAISDPNTGGQDSVSASRTIRWCPADLEE